MLVKTEATSARPDSGTPSGARLASILLFPITLVGTHWAAIEAIGRSLDPTLVVAAIIPIAVVIVSVAERLLPHLPDWNRPRGDVVTDVWHIVVGGLTAPQLYRFLLGLMLVPAAAAIAQTVGAPVWPSGWPLIAQLALAALVAEFGQYWAHRLAHETRLWRLHAVHHSPERLYCLNFLRDHPLGLLLLYAPQVAPLLALGCNAQTFALFALFTTVHGLFQHSNVEVRLGPLNWLFSMAELHRWHHSTIVREGNHNYGANLIVWDAAFGSRWLPRGHPSEVGIAGMPDFPRGYLGQLSVPFRWKGLLEPVGPTPSGGGSPRDGRERIARFIDAVSGPRPRRALGACLLVVSIALPLSSPLAALLPAPLAQRAAVGGALVLAGEVCGALGLLLVGPEVVQAVRRRSPLGLWRRWRAVRRPRP